MQKEKMDFFHPGTLTTQYITDNYCCVGIVIGDEWANKKLDEDQLKLFKSHFDEGGIRKHYVCLILGYFFNSNDYWKIFGEDKLKRFPSYIAVEKRTATPVTLLEELSLFRFHKDQDTSRGLRFTNLQCRIFGFNNHQSETLKVVALVQHYLSGGSIESLPRWIGYFFEPNVEKIFAELSEVISLDD